jgi:hypothetical protein
MNYLKKLIIPKKEEYEIKHIKDLKLPLFFTYPKKLITPYDKNDTIIWSETTEDTNIHFTQSEDKIYIQIFEPATINNKKILINLFTIDNNTSLSILKNDDSRFSKIYNNLNIVVEKFVDNDGTDNYKYVVKDTSQLEKNNTEQDQEKNNTEQDQEKNNTEIQEQEKTVTINDLIEMNTNTNTKYKYKYPNFFFDKKIDWDTTKDETDIELVITRDNNNNIKLYTKETPKFEKKNLARVININGEIGDKTVNITIKGNDININSSLHIGVKKNNNGTYSLNISSNDFGIAGGRKQKSSRRKSHKKKTRRNRRKSVRRNRNRNRNYRR